MAQQPNVELNPGDLPRRPLPLPASRRWTPAIKPGVVTTPGDVPRGPAFGTPSPDTGWALRIIRRTGAEAHPPRLQDLLAVLMAARASAFGRAPVSDDLAVASILCGLGESLPEYLVERRLRWLGALGHEGRKGRMAVAEIDPDLLRMTPGEVRRAVTLRRPAG